MQNVDKKLIVDKRIIQIISFFMNMMELTNSKIDKKIEILGPNKPESENLVFVYIIPADVDCFYTIEDHISQHKKERDKNYLIPLKEFHTLVIPRMNTFCYDFVQNSPYRFEFNVHNIYIDVYPLDYDLLSLEENNALYSLYIDKNTSILSQMARIVTKIEEIFGKIKYTYCKGNLAKTTYESILYEENCSVSLGKENLEGILNCFIFDRSVDFVSLFCSQYNYQGLIDELFNIKFNKIKVNAELLGKRMPEPPKEEEKKETKEKGKKNKKEEVKEEPKEEKKEELITFDLSEKDKFFYFIKDYHFGKVRNFLPLRLRQHEEISKKAKHTREMADVQKYISLYSKAKEERPSLMNHISLAEYIVTLHNKHDYRQILSYEQTLLTDEELPSTYRNYIQNLLWSKTKTNTLLRLLCLESLTHGGLGKYYEEFRKDYINVYGYQELPFLYNLDKLRILFHKDKEINYFYIFKQLNLLCEDINIQNPNSPSYVFSGLYPTIVKIIENVMTKGYNSVIPVLTKMPGYFTDQVSEIEEKETLNRYKDRDSVSLVIFLGGVTYAEIAALRFLGKNLNIHFIILTTHIITTDRFFQEIRAEIGIEPEYTLSGFFKDYTAMKEKEKK
ncbi:MAG: Sec1 family protein [archaeon]|nr:Sec1 family protein [archaeon]